MILLYTHDHGLYLTWKSLFIQRVKKEINMKSSNEVEVLPVEPYKLTEGPLPKSMHTYQLEAITRQLLMDKDFTFTKENNEDYITIDKVKYNWTEIIKYANLDHIELNRHDFRLYSKYIQSVTVKPSLHPDFEPHYISELYQNYYSNNRELPEPLISFQEMQAINVYTGGFYRQMNDVLRGEFDFKTEDKTTAREAIIQSIVCASGLRKIPETTITDAYRGGKMPSTVEHNERIKAAEKHGVIQLSGFVSSSTDKGESFSHKPVDFHFTNLKGAYIAPISQSPHEKEFLIPPTQVQLTDYRFKNGRHYFEGRVVSDLASKDDHGLDVGHTPNRPTNIQTIEPKLSDISSYEKLSDLLLDISPEDCKSVCEAKKNLIASADDFANLMEFLSLEQREAVYEVMVKDNRLIAMIQSGKDFNNVVKFLSPRQYTSVFDNIKDVLPHIIQSTTNDLAFVQQHLTPAQFTAVLEAMGDRLLSVIQSNLDLDNLFENLAVDQLTAVLAVMIEKDQLSHIIRSGQNFARVMPSINLEQRTAVIAAFTDKWRDLIQSSQDFVGVMRYLNMEQRKGVINAFTDKWPDLIQSVYDFEDVMKNLNPEQGMAVVIALTHKWPDLIISKYDFDDVVKNINPEQGMAVVIALTHKWPELIESWYDFASVLRYRNPEQITAIIVALTNKWPDLIKSSDDLYNVMRLLSPDQCAIVIDAMKDALPRIISESGIAFSNMLESLSPEQSETLISIKELMDKKLMNNLVKDPFANNANESHSGKEITQQYKKEIKKLTAEESINHDNTPKNN